MSTVTGNGVAYPEPPPKGVRHVPDLGPEARNQHRKGRCYVRRNAFTRARCLSPPICQRLSRSAGQRERAPELRRVAVVTLDAERAC